MGSSSSKEVATRAVTQSVTIQTKEEDPAERARKMKECTDLMYAQLDSKLKEVEKEVHQVQHVITQGVRETVNETKSCSILEYEDLKDMSKITMNLEKLLQGTKGAKIIIDMAKNIVEVMQDTEELKKMCRWHQHHVIQSYPGIDGKPGIVMGLEMHYKVVVIDESILAGIMKRVFGIGQSSKKKTTVLVAFKVVTHVMEQDPSKIPSKAQLDAIDF